MRTTRKNTDGLRARETKIIHTRVYIIYGTTEHLFSLKVSFQLELQLANRDAARKDSQLYLKSAKNIWHHRQKAELLIVTACRGDH